MSAERSLVALPETVQAGLASRIDRLSPRDKDVLQAAAVVGRDVPTELRPAVVDLPGPELAAALKRLATAECTLSDLHDPTARRGSAVGL